MRRIGTVLPLLLVAALAIGGLITACGIDEANDEAEAYVERLDDIDEQFTTELERFVHEEPTTQRDWEITVEGILSAIDNHAVLLRGLDPPEAVASEHRRLIELNRTIREPVAEALKAAEEGNYHAASESLRRWNRERASWNEKHLAAQREIAEQLLE